MSVFNLLLLSYFDHRYKIFSDSEEIALAQSQAVGVEGVSALSGTAPLDGDLGYDEDQPVNFVIVDSAYLLNDNNPLSNILPTRDGLIIYKIQKGDTLSRIAANFGISVNTILWANKDLSSFVSPGQEIVILPVSGVLHQIQPGDTLESIASQYGVDVKKIIEFNRGLSPAKIELRSAIIIPQGKPLKSSNIVLASNLPNLPGYFAIPTTGWNWGRLHSYNAVDIANACGTPVYASAEGLVVETESSGWNGGYGQYLIIEHLNNTRTRYAHLQQIEVSVGDYVVKGDLVGQVGNTGNSHGPTGCHLHFEVIGARNPFAK